MAAEKSVRRAGALLRGNKSNARREGNAPVVESLSPASPACACGTHAGEGQGRRAVGVDPEIKARNLTRLRRIEGQVRGLQRMVEEERYCADVLTQISSVHEALRSVARELMRNHLKHCASHAIKAGEGEAEAMYDELIDLFYTHSR